MSAAAKAEVIEKVRASVLPVSKVLNELGVPRSNYYRWIKPKQHSAPAPVKVPWNRLSDAEQETVLGVARAWPEWSSRQVAAWVTWRRRAVAPSSADTLYLLNTFIYVSLQSTRPLEIVALPDAATGGSTMISNSLADVPRKSWARVNVRNSGHDAAFRVVPRHLLLSLLSLVALILVDQVCAPSSFLTA